MTRNLNIQDQNVINVLEIANIELGKEPIKDSVEAYFPCSVTWCSKNIDKHVAEQDNELRATENIYICSFSKTYITPGIYIRINAEKNLILFEKLSD